MHPKSDVDRLYISRKYGGRDLTATGNYAELAVRGLEEYIHGRGERLI